MTAEPVNSGGMNSMTPEHQSGLDEQLLAQLPHRDRRVIQDREERYRQVAETRNGMVKWLSRFPWTLLAHLTASSMPTVDSARQALEWWQKKISQVAWGRNFWKRPGQGVYGFGVLAPQERGQYHVHALVANTNGLSPHDAAACWNRSGVVEHHQHGHSGDGHHRELVRIAKVDRFRHGGGGVEYVVGHLTHDEKTGSSFHLFGKWPHG